MPLATLGQGPEHQSHQLARSCTRGGGNVDRRSVGVLRNRRSLSPLGVSLLRLNPTRSSALQSGPQRSPSKPKQHPRCMLELNLAGAAAGEAGGNCCKGELTCGLWTQPLQQHRVRFKVHSHKPLQQVSVLLNETFNKDTRKGNQQYLSPLPLPFQIPIHQQFGPLFPPPKK